MPTIRTPAILLCGIALTGCNAFTSAKNYCGKEPFVCSVAASAIVASIALTVAASSGGGKDGGRPRRTTGASLGLGSDSRLKQDVRPTRILENDIQLYRFRYWNDSRTFEGVMAQDLLEDERFKHAVHVSPQGYYTVDLSAVGLEMTGDAGQYIEAGRKALEAAGPEEYSSQGVFRRKM